MTKSVVPGESPPLDPQLDGLTAYLTRIRSNSCRSSLESAGEMVVSPSVLAVLQSLKEIYKFKPK